MKLRVLLPALCICALPAAAQTGFPFQDESLHYSVNWPSGLSLGDVTMAAHHSANGWEFEMTFNAGVAGLRLSDRFHSVTSLALCSTELDRDLNQGSKRTNERTTFDYQAGVAHRVSLSGGGNSDVPFSGTCAHDALAYLYVARRTLGQGAVPPPEQVFLGPLYSVQLTYGGAQTIPVGGVPTITDLVNLTAKGPSSNTTAELYFARDAARTPLLARISTSVGVVSLELTH